MPPEVLKAFSRRRAEIVAELERLGTSGRTAAQVATLATRRAKDYRVSPEASMPQWRARAEELGFGLRVELQAARWASMWPARFISGIEIPGAERPSEQRPRESSPANSPCDEQGRGNRAPASQPRHRTTSRYPSLAYCRGPRMTLIRAGEHDSASFDSAASCAWLPARSPARRHPSEGGAPLGIRPSRRRLRGPPSTRGRSPGPTRRRPLAAHAPRLAGRRPRPRIRLDESFHGR